MKSNLHEHLAWFELSVKPNVMTPVSANTRCWEATKEKPVKPFDPTASKYHKTPNADRNDFEIVSTNPLTNQRKRRRVMSDSEDDDDDGGGNEESEEDKEKDEDEEEEEEEEEEEVITFASVAVQTSPLLSGVDAILERTQSMETIYFDAMDEFYSDQKEQHNKEEVKKVEEEADEEEQLYKIIHEKLVTLFKYNVFIPNQLEAIYTTLKEQHVLLVLPSGPCRELCYLLPSTITSSKLIKRKNGKTFVLLPLSELLPNVDHYSQIPKLIIVGNSSNNHSNNSNNSNSSRRPWITIDQLYEAICTCDVKVVYMTIRDFVRHKDIIQELYNQNLISRLVIEESHCLSIRSQGFYQVKYPRLVSNIRLTYPDLPVMALTSIPFDTVHSDIIEALSIQNCKIYKKSLLL